MKKILRELVKCNVTPTLERERLRCAKLAAKLGREQAQLRKSRDEWEPAFRRWYDEVARPLADQARRLTVLMRDQAMFIEHVEETARLLYCTPREAKARSRAALRGHVIFEELVEEFYETQHFPRGPLHADVEEHLRLEYARMVYPLKSPAELETLFQEYKRAVLSARFGWEAAAPVTAHEEARLKRLYRELARRLHPDSNPSITEEDRALWHEVTAAFQVQDAETLEALLAAHEGGERFSAIDSLSRLRAILGHLERKLKETGRSLRRERREPWWKFGERRSPEELAREIRAEQERTIEAAQRTLAEQEARMKAWEA